MAAENLCVLIQKEFEYDKEKNSYWMKEVAWFYHAFFLNLKCNTSMYPDHKLYHARGEYIAWNNMIYK